MVQFKHLLRRKKSLRYPYMKMRSEKSRFGGVPFSRNGLDDLYREQVAGSQNYANLVLSKALSACDAIAAVLHLQRVKPLLQ